MSGPLWSWKPAFQAIVVNGPLATPAAPVATRIDFAGSLFGVNGYRVAAGFDGARLLGATIAGATTNATGIGNPYGVLITWTAVPGATSYRVYRNGSLIFVTSGLVAFDFGLAPMAETVPAGVTPASYIIDMSPTYGGVGPTPPWLERSKARIESVTYDDLSDPEAYASPRRALVAKEFGCRAVVEMMFQVGAGTQEDKEIVALWDWKLAFPNGPTTPGVQLSFTLSKGNPLQGYAGCRIVGPLVRVPSSGKNMLVVNRFKVMVIEPSASVPDLSFNQSGDGWWVS